MTPNGSIPAENGSAPTEIILTRKPRSSRAFDSPLVNAHESVRHSVYPFILISQEHPLEIDVQFQTFHTPTRQVRLCRIFQLRLLVDCGDVSGERSLGIPSHPSTWKAVLSRMPKGSASTSCRSLSRGPRQLFELLVCQIFGLPLDRLLLSVELRKRNPRFHHLHLQFFREGFCFPLPGFSYRAGRVSCTE